MKLLDRLGQAGLGISFAYSGLLVLLRGRKELQDLSGWDKFNAGWPFMMAMTACFFMAFVALRFAMRGKKEDGK